jgi:putative aldouronate transport system substrate-binding protein
MKKSRIFTLIIAVAMMLALFAGCKKTETTGTGTPTGTTAPTAAPTAAAIKDLKMLTNVTGGKDEAEMKIFAEQLGKATGLSVTIDKPASDYGKVLMQKLQAGEKYDLIYITMGDVPNLVSQSAIKDLTDLVKKSPILGDTSNIPQSEWDAIKVNGKIYASFNKKEVHRVVNVNSVIATKAGVDVTKIDPTLDGY